MKYERLRNCSLSPQLRCSRPYDVEGSEVGHPSEGHNLNDADNLTDLEASRKDSEDKMAQYKIVKLLSSGRSGAVHLVEDINGDHFAMKVIGDNRRNKRVAETEVEIMRKVGKEKYFCHLKDFFHTEDEHEKNYIIVMEYFDGISLKKFIETSEIISDDLSFILWQIGHALKKLHKIGVLHNDVNERNILVNSSHEIKLIDFGNVEIVDAKRLKGHFVFPWAKNLIHGHLDDYEVLGGMLCDVFFETFPDDLLDSLQERNPKRLEIQKAIKEAYERVDTFYPFAADSLELDFLFQLLTPNENKRLNDKTYFHHPIFKNIDTKEKKEKN